MCVIPHNAWEFWGFIRSHLRCCARAVTIRVLRAGGHCHIQIDTQLSHIEYKVYLYRYYANTNNSCVLLHSACCIREETCSQNKFGHKTEFMSNEMQRLIKFDADVAYSTIVSFVICSSSFCLRHTLFSARHWHYWENPSLYHWDDETLCKSHSASPQQLWLSPLDSGFILHRLKDQYVKVLNLLSRYYFSLLLLNNILVWYCSSSLPPPSHSISF